jgi:hypothetical protein
MVLAAPLAFRGSSHAVSRSRALSKPMKGASNRLWGTLVFLVTRSKWFLCGRRKKSLWTQDSDSRFGRLTVGFSYYDDQCHTRNGTSGSHAGHSS